MSGCTNPTVSKIIQGEFLPNGANHGKPVYKKENPPSNVTVLIYYWDSRDGPSFHGWWFGPKVGGDQVWAYAPAAETSIMPPHVGWKVPWDGNEDEAMRLDYVLPGASGGRGPPPRGDEDRRRESDRRRDEEERRRAEEHRRRQEERREEEIRRRKEEEEEERRRRRREREQREQDAAADVRRAIQRLRGAQPETYESVKSEVDRVMHQCHEALGSMHSKISKEVEDAVTEAKQRVADIKRRREEEEKRRQENERRRKEEEMRVDALFKEAEGCVKEAEESVSAAEASAKAAAAGGSDRSVETLQGAAEAASKQLTAARDTLTRCEKDVARKSADIGGGEVGRRYKKEVFGLEGRLRSCQKQLDQASEDVAAAEARVVRRAAALRREVELQECFQRHDCDGDGLLDRLEVLTFGREEFSYDLPEEVVDRILRVLTPIGPEKLYALRQKVAIAKLEADERERQSQEEHRRQELEKQRDEAVQAVEQATKIIEELDHKTSSASSQAKKASEDKESRSEQLFSRAKEVEDFIAEAAALLQKAMANISQAEEMVNKEPELKKMRRWEMRWLRGREAELKEHIEKIQPTLEEVKSRAAAKAKEELEMIMKELLVALRSYMTEQAKTSEQLFDQLHKGEAVSQEVFLKFVKDVHQVTLDDAQQKQLWEHWVGEAKELNKERFVDLLRLFYHCVKGTVLTEDISIKSKTLKKLQEGDVVEVLEGPKKEDVAGVLRVRCQATPEGPAGWATVCGNQGTVFLELKR